MLRVAEPELMNEPEQVAAYANADFEQAHSSVIELFAQTFQGQACLQGNSTPLALDAGCGPADISRRFLQRYPHFHITAVDAAANMIETASNMNRDCGLQDNIQLICQRIDEFKVTDNKFDVFISNSLLHHLHQPEQLWHLVNRACKPGTLVFIMDLLRPINTQLAQQLVDTYAPDEPEILRQDFYHSLCAAYRQEEITEQLSQHGLGYLDVKACSDRHLMISGIIK